MLTLERFINSLDDNTNVCIAINKTENGKYAEVGKFKAVVWKKALEQWHIGCKKIISYEINTDKSLIYNIIVDMEKDIFYFGLKTSAEKIDENY